MFIDSGFDVYVNGAQVGNGNDGLQTGLAGLALFETHGNFTIASGFLNYFYGTIFAPSGGVTMDVQDMFGSILASGPITWNAYISLRSSQVLGVSGTSLGDYNGSGKVDATDYDLWKANFDTSNAAVDGNGNGIVDAADYSIWRDHLVQMVSGAGSAAPIPEPSALVTLGLGATFGWFCLGRRAQFARLKTDRVRNGSSIVGGRRD